MEGSGQPRLVAFAPDVRFVRKVGGVVEVVAPTSRFLTSERNAHLIREALATCPGQFEEGELHERSGLDAAVVPLLRKLLVDAGTVTGSKLAELYERIGRELPDPRFVFQNHGYAEEGETFDWLRPEDEGHRYPLNLARYLVAGLPLDDRMILDVGCGRGGTCSFLVRYFRPRGVVGLEYSSSCVELCRRVHAHPRLGFVRGDAALLPFADESFDVVTNLESSHCYPAPWRFYAEVLRVLRPGGSFCYTDMFGDLGEPARVRQRLESLGFAVALEDDITDRVARGLAAGYRDFERLLGGMVSEQRGNADLIETMLRSIERISSEAYVRGRAVYVAWRLTKPASGDARDRAGRGT